MHRIGHLLLAWPTKLTFAPALADLVVERLKDVTPAGAQCAPPPLPAADVGAYPWDTADWQKIA